MQPANGVKELKAGAIILAGGKSSRMGTNKALLPIGDRTTIEILAERMLTVFDEVIVVANDPGTYQFLNVPVITDHFPGEGPLAGIHAGLKASSYDLNLVMACDMPFASSELAALFVEKARDFEAVVPNIKGKLHPLFAVYQKHVSEKAGECLKKGKRRVTDLLDGLNVLYLDEKALAAETDVSVDDLFFNMNRPGEYETAKKKAEQRPL